jgi:hypothetical protein
MATGPLAGGLIYDTFASYAWLNIGSWIMGPGALSIRAQRAKVEAILAAASTAADRTDALLLLRPIDPTGKSVADFQNPLSSPSRKNIPLSPLGKSVI